MVPKTASDGAAEEARVGGYGARNSAIAADRGELLDTGIPQMLVPSHRNPTSNSRLKYAFAVECGELAISAIAQLGGRNGCRFFHSGRCATGSSLISWLILSASARSRNTGTNHTPGSTPTRDNEAVAFR
jgi:hypothetical protein